MPETPEVRRSVRALLTSSPAYPQLKAGRQQRLAGGVEEIARYLVRVEPPRVAASLLAAVDFPDFVRALIDGVFGAIVGASIQQMDDYVELVAAVSASLDKFRDTHVSDAAARRTLCEAYPPLCDDPHRAISPAGSGLTLPDSKAAAIWRRHASSRQQLLATMVMMGVSR